MKLNIPEVAAGAKRGVEFDVRYGAVPNGPTVHVLFNGKEVAIIFPDVEREGGIVIASPHFSDFTKQIKIEHATMDPRRPAMIAISWTPTIKQ